MVVTVSRAAPSFINKNLLEIVHYKSHYQNNFKNCERCVNFVNTQNEYEKGMAI